MSEDDRRGRKLYLDQPEDLDQAGSASAFVVHPSTNAQQHFSSPATELNSLLPGTNLTVKEGEKDTIAKIGLLYCLFDNLSLFKCLSADLLEIEETARHLASEAASTETDTSEPSTNYPARNSPSVIFPSIENKPVIVAANSTFAYDSGRNLNGVTVNLISSYSENL